MGFPSWAHVGATVICVKEGGWKNSSGWVPPVVPSFMQAYTIIELVESKLLIAHRGIRLREFGTELTFTLAAFRPPVRMHKEHETRVEEPV